MSPIAQRQNRPEQIQRLAAQRQLYTKAKTILCWEILLSVPAVIAWSFIVLASPSMQVVAALWGIVLTITDCVLLSAWQDRLKDRAAKIQE